MRRPGFVLLLMAGVLVIAVSIYGSVLLRGRPGLAPSLAGGVVAEFDGVEVENADDLEFLLSRRRIGDRISVVVRREDGLSREETELVPYYAGNVFPEIYLTIGLICLGLGFSVILLRREEAKARIFYLASLAFSTSLIISGGFFCLRQSQLSYLPGLLFYLAYPLTPVLFLHFSLQFWPEPDKIKKVFLSIPAFVFAAALGGLFLYSGLKSSIGTYRLYQSVLYVFRVYLILYLLAALAIFIISYRKARLERQKAQIQWILYGLSVGMTPFVLFYQLPLVLHIRPLLSEEFSSVFFIVIPVAFAIAIIRFKLMNIELVINRSLVYFFLTVFTVAFYLTLVRLLHGFLSGFVDIRDTAVSLIAALAAAVVFNPVRGQVQRVVDKTFFRQSYDYRQSILSFNTRAHRMVDKEQLADYLLQKLDQTLPLEKRSLFILSAQSKRPKLLMRRDGQTDFRSLHSRISGRDKVFARPSSVRTDENIDFSLESLLLENKIELAVPLSFRSTSLTGFIALGKKKSGERYTHDDLQLIQSLAGEFALNLERIHLQEEVIYERAAKVKLDEMNRLKTEFISTVSHELRTPMSSLQGLSEMLQQEKVKSEAKRAEMAHLLANECQRLSQFVHNILDFGRIETKTKQYNIQDLVLQPVIEDVVSLLKFGRGAEKRTVQIHMPEKPVILKADRNALRQALINLLDNAFKYSSQEQEIDVVVIEEAKAVEIRVQDRGIGISPRDQKKVFEGFHRAEDAVRKQPHGVGLGLKVVKHIMKAHNGDIRVESQPQQGSTFCLVFPRP